MARRARRTARRSYRTRAARGGVRRGRQSGRGQTVRIVIEQPSTIGTIARPGPGVQGAAFVTPVQPRGRSRF